MPIIKHETSCIHHGGIRHLPGVEVRVSDEEAERLCAAGAIRMDLRQKTKPAPDRAPSDDTSPAKAEAEAEADSAEEADPPKTSRRRRRRKGASS